MPDDLESEELTEGNLALGPTRPVLLVGLPLPLALALGGTGFMIMMTGNSVWHIVYAVVFVGPVWWGLRFLVSKDYHAVGILWRWAKGPMWRLDARRYGGNSVSPFPFRTPKSRGMR